MNRMLFVKLVFYSQMVTMPSVFKTELTRMAKMHTGAIHLTIME